MAQSASSEEAAIQAQIANFVNQNKQTAPGAEPVPTPTPTTNNNPSEVSTAPQAETPQASRDALMASAIKNLVSDDTEKPAAASEKIVEPSPAPAVPPGTTEQTTQPAATSAVPTTDQATTTEPIDDDSVTVAHKKIIAPITDGSTPRRPDLNELLAKEGFTPEDIHNEPTNPQTGLPSAPHPPGHVISPNPTEPTQPGQPGGFDPNSIAL